MDDEDFLDAVEADNAALGAEDVKEPPKKAEPEAEPAPEPALEPEAQAEPAASEPANPLDPPVLDTKPDPGFVPISVVLDEREKRQRAEAEVAQFRAAQARQQQADIPDRWEDPEGHDQYQDQKVAAALYQANMRWSERIASVQHGAETVTEAKKWGYARCDADPFFNAKVAASEDPIDFVISEWKRDQFAAQVSPDDFAEFKAWKTAQAQIQTPAPPAVAATPPLSRSIPPRSLASAPSAGGVMTEAEQSDEEIFAETFDRKT